MKTATLILKILAAIAAVAGVIYLIATYGDKVVAWFKRLLGKDEFACDCDECECDCEDCECECCCDCEEEDEEPTAVEEDFAEEE